MLPAINAFRQGSVMLTAINAFRQRAVMMTAINAFGTSIRLRHQVLWRLILKEVRGF